MPNIWFKKGLAIGIILLFIGIGIQPAISNEVTIPAISDSKKDNIEYKINEKMYLSEKLLNNIVSSLDIKSNDDCGCSDGDDYPIVLCAILWYQMAFATLLWWKTGWDVPMIIINAIGVKYNCPDFV